MLIRPERVVFDPPARHAFPLQRLDFHSFGGGGGWGGERGKGRITDPRFFIVISDKKGKLLKLYIAKEIVSIRQKKLISFHNYILMCTCTYFD